MEWAIRIKYLESRYTGDGKWHTHTTKWHEDNADAWEEADSFLDSRTNIDESSCSLIHRGW